MDLHVSWLNSFNLFREGRYCSRSNYARNQAGCAWLKLREWMLVSATPVAPDSLSLNRFQGCCIPRSVEAHSFTGVPKMRWGCAFLGWEQWERRLQPERNQRLHQIGLQPRQEKNGTHQHWNCAGTTWKPHLGSEP